MVDTSEIDLLERKCRENRVTAVINAISTFNVGVAMELSKRLNLPCYCAPSAWNYTKTIVIRIMDNHLFP